MRNKIFLVFAIIVSLFCYGDDAMGSSPFQDSSNSALPSDSFCSNLSPDESAFAEKLSSLHQVIFCQLYGPDLRAQAMAFISVSSLNKSSGMTNDMAVEMTLKNCRGMKALPEGVTPFRPPLVNENPQAEPKIQPQTQPPGQPKRKGPCALIPKGT